LRTHYFNRENSDYSTPESTISRRRAWNLSGNFCTIRFKQVCLADSSERTPTKTADAPRLPSLPAGVSRVDKLTDEFAAFLARKPVLVGDVIANRYRLLESLGAGAMGEVFIAENLSIGRRVAVKVLRSELLMDAQFRDRFQHEAEAIAAIDHRNVVRFLDLIVGDPTFLVMEYAQGPTLGAELAGGPLEPVRAVNIAMRLAWALDAAHRAGVIHRDVKPENVILAPDSELGEEPKLIDFGLAKLTLGRERELTRAGQILGTPYYIAPEQVENRDVDARCDVYSLGCLMFHMLTGRPPFVAEDAMQILYQHVHSPAPRLNAVKPELPAPLDALLARALAKAPRDRFADMRELIAALQKVERRKPRAASRASAASPAWPAGIDPTLPRARRTPWWALAGAAALALFALVLAWRTRSAPSSTLLLVGSQPSGAAIELDGADTGERTPAAIPVEPGHHALRLRGAGSGVVEQSVELARGQRLLVEPVLPPSSHALTIQSAPAGALVFVDGRLMPGQTPLTAEISDEDFHQVRVEKRGFVTALRNLTPEDRAPSLTVSLEPEAAPRATVWIDANRAASVEIDGFDTGLITPTIGIRVKPGRHEIIVRDASGEKSPKAVIDVARGETRHLTLDFAGGTR
jgi:serine/threonine-protein kinase